MGRLAYAYGLQEEPAPRTPESLIKDFSWDKVPKKDICLPEGLFEVTETRKRPSIVLRLKQNLKVIFLSLQKRA